MIVSLQALFGGSWCDRPRPRVIGLVAPVVWRSLQLIRFWLTRILGAGLGSEIAVTRIIGRAELDLP